MAIPSRDELRAFLAALSGSGRSANRVPPALERLARRVARGDDEAGRDLLGALFVDLLSRRGQSGAIDHLLKLGDAALSAALVKRLVQVRAGGFDSRARIMKSLRAHVAAALAGPLPVTVGLPLSLVEGDRISSERVREAVSALAARTEWVRGSPREVSAELMALYFDPMQRAPVARAEVATEDEAIRRLDTERHAEALRRELGSEDAQVLARRGIGFSLRLAGGGLAVSTVHGRLAAAIPAVRLYAERHALQAEDLETICIRLVA